MIRTLWVGGQARILTLALSVLLCACGARPQAAPGMRQPVLDSALDSAVFVTVLEAQRARMGKLQPLRIDPRPLRDDPSVDEPTPQNIQAGPAGIVLQRTRLLARMGAVRADATEDFACAGRGEGLHSPGEARPDSARGDSDPCRAKGQFGSFILGLPRPGGASRSVGETGGHPGGDREAVYAVRVLYSDFGGYLVLDVIVAREPSGAWRVVEEKTLGGFAT